MLNLSLQIPQNSLYTKQRNQRKSSLGEAERGLEANTISSGERHNNDACQNHSHDQSS